MHIKGSLLYFIDKFGDFKTTSFLNELQETQFLSAEELKLQQWGKLKILLDYVYKKSELYRSRFKQNNLLPSDIKCQEDFEKFPITTKEDLEKYKTQIIPGKGSFFIKSSGSTCDRISKTYVTFEAASRKFALYLRHLYRAGWNFDTKVIYFLPLLYKGKILDNKNGIKQFFSTYAQNKVAHGFFTNREILYYNILDPIIKPEVLKLYHKKINAYKNKILMGRADFLNILIHNLREANLKIITPKAIINIGVLLPEALKIKIASFFNCPVYNIYGSSELSYIAGSCVKGDDLHINEESHYVEIIRNGNSYLESVRKGKIIVTDLFNYSMPLIRYNLGDVGNITKSNCDLGGLRLLEVNGRERNCIESDEGISVTEKEISNAIFGEENILQFHLKFLRNIETELQIVNTGLSISEERLVKKLSSIGLKKLKIKYVDRLSMYYRDKLQYVSTV